MKVLMPLDGSKFAEAVLQPAAQLAACSGAEVHLIEVVSVIHPAWVHHPSGAREDQAWRIKMGLSDTQGSAELGRRIHGNHP